MKVERTVLGLLHLPTDEPEQAWIDTAIAWATEHKTDVKLWLNLKTGELVCQAADAPEPGDDWGVYGLVKAS